MRNKYGTKAILQSLLLYYHVLCNLSKLEYLDVSSLSAMKGMQNVLPDSICRLENLRSLELHDCYLGGSIPTCFGELLSLEIIYLGDNQFNGTLSEVHFEKLSKLQYMDLSSSNLKLNMKPDWVPPIRRILSFGEEGNCTSLVALDLGENHLVGNVPSTLGQLHDLVSLHLNANNLTEELPSSMANCTSLKYIDLSMNELTGSIPTWFPESFPDLEILSLRSNKFTGKIPPKLPNLGYLQTGDISTNGETFILSANGKLNEYTQILSLVVSMDFSDNLISGEIPDELSDLSGLVHLNLSGNHLSGKIPQDIGNLHELISLDLSRNIQLSGPIPSSLSKLSFLQHSNVSDNKLHGKIPSGSQLQTLNDASIYMGNAGLCGSPLSKICAENKTPPSVVHEEKSAKEHIEMLWMYIGIGHGFVVGFCGRKALTKFKQGLVDPANRLASWDNGPDCCKWDGVSCDNQTGYVFQLNLRNPHDKYPIADYFQSSLGGQIDPALQELKHLQYLDLGGNSFVGLRIPDFLGSFQRLRYLNLSFAGFAERIPQQIGNLSTLEVLDLSSGIGYAPSSLKQLRMNGVNMTGVSHDWAQVMNSLPYLREIYLAGCGISHIPQTLPFTNFTRLRVLDLQSNLLNSTIPSWVVNITSLESIDLSFNQFSGLPPNLGNLSKLEYLDVSSLSAMKGMQNVLPDSICRLENLRTLVLHDCNLGGSIPTCFGELLSLEIIYLGDNQFNGTLSEVHFEKLSKLQHEARLGAPIPDSNIFLGSCRFEGNKFPSWLQTQKSIQYLILQNASISDRIPSWLWNFAPNLTCLSIRENDIFGQLPSSPMAQSKLLQLYVQQNKLSGPIPDNFLRAQNSLNEFLASGNLFNGTIPHTLGKLENLVILDLSNNDLIGSIPSELCDGRHEYLVLSKNHLTGNIPSSVGNCTHLRVLGLRENQLTGSIPSTLGQLSQLKSLHLNSNNLREELPYSLANCSSLTLLDLSNNKLNGSIPTWFPMSFPQLAVLNLRSNMLTGNIPEKLSNLGSLQVLDLAKNYLHGSIPKTLHNFQTMQKRQDLNDTRIGVNRFLYKESLILSANGKLNEYREILSLVVSMDLSDNLISGEIPAELSDLLGLIVLNLSGNHLSGKIPQDIGNLQELMSLDLSRNQLSGPIPASLSKLSFLQHLNVSYNKLHGMIPSGTQLQTLIDPSIYMGNAGLCGPPLSNNCTANKTPPSVSHEEKSVKEQNEMLWVYIGMSHGFVVGFCGVFGIFAFKKGWRIAFFRFFDDLYEWIIMVWSLNISRLQKKIRKDN
ncbi:hypothetical protein H6P81_017157 [Aristolochia fimbriata]|uniref:Leucine-rich repeat-containing N-terminal plant-type domain-containing protein n=1 Tax=Aristolochia fimbriata TaxID=158543 RepID=A0AAV7E1L5_ARIFI|nr:hypothetical protein H6P81_017157 [Aristolochia fimbriata]